MYLWKNRKSNIDKILFAKWCQLKKKQVFATLLAPRWILLVEMHQGELVRLTMRGFSQQN